MTRLRLKYVNAVHWNGRRYFYFRRKGSKRTPLPGLPGSAEFMEAYQAALAGAAETKIEIGEARTLPGSVNAAIALYYKHPSFTKNKPITQRTDRNILETFRGTVTSALPCWPSSTLRR